MWVWDRSIGLWLWGVFQPNQEIKCLFAQLDRPTTNQSNVVCDYSSGGSLACFCVYWTKKFRMSPDVSGTRRAQAALLPGARYEPRVSPVRGPGAPRPGPGAPLAARELRTGDLSSIVWSPPWQFDWSGWFSYQHNFSSTERCQTELPQQTMLWAGLSSSGIQANSGPHCWKNVTTCVSDHLRFTWDANTRSEQGCWHNCFYNNQFMWVSF